METIFDLDSKEYIENILNIGEETNYKKDNVTISRWKFGFGNPATRARVVLKKYSIELYVGDKTPAYAPVKNMASSFLDEHLKHSNYELAFRFKSLEDAELVLSLLAECFKTGRVMALDEKYTYEERKAHAKTISLNNLNRIAHEQSRDVVKEIQTTVLQKVRNPYIAEYAKRRANGICQLCGEKAPFLNKDGEPYLESHHIIWLANGGGDTVENTVALCPNCHCKMHVLNDSTDVEKLKKINSEFDEL